MNKTNNVRLLNGTDSACSYVLLSRQLLFYGLSEGSMQSPEDKLLIESLKKLMAAIQDYLEQYIGYLTGDLNSLPQNLTQDVIQMLSSTFFNLKEPALMSSVYEQYRLFAVSLIPAFQNVSSQITNCQSIESQLQIALEKANILDDVNKLKEYISKLKTSFNIIPDQTINVPIALIKEPYNTYIKLFGFPDNMIWDPEKLSFVTEYLGIV